MLKKTSRKWTFKKVSRYPAWKTTTATVKSQLTKENKEHFENRIAHMRKAQEAYYEMLVWPLSSDERRGVEWILEKIAKEIDVYERWPEKCTVGTQEDNEFYISICVESNEAMLAKINNQYQKILKICSDRICGG